MNLSVIDWVGLASFVGSIAAVIKAFKSDGEARAARSETEVIREERETTKRERNDQLTNIKQELAVINNENKHFAERLDRGDNRFEKLEEKIDKLAYNQEVTNKTLVDISVTLREMRRVPQHQPEVR